MISDRGRVFGSLLPLFAILSCKPTASPDAPKAPHFVAEGYPVDVAQSLASYEELLKGAAPHIGPQPTWVIIQSQRRWLPGETIRVAFNGGSATVRAQIESAAQEWTKPGYANIHLQFHAANGSFLEWKPDDKSFSAEVRVSFAPDAVHGGLWSLIGRDSINEAIGVASPGKPSMNLSGFDQNLPSDWRARVIHEFGHALGFFHELQSPAGGCDFQFQDDPGYVKTLDSDGWFTFDKHSPPRRPGLYTYLGGKSNYWPPARVDANYKVLTSSSAFDAGPFDKLSIMKYPTDAILLRKGEQSPCYTGDENLAISSEDKAGIAKAYPAAPADAAAVARSQLAIGARLAAEPTLVADKRSAFAENLRRLRSKARALRY